MRSSDQVNRHDEARRNRSIQRLLKAREALQLEALYLGGRPGVMKEYGTVLAALRSGWCRCHAGQAYGGESSRGSEVTTMRFKVTVRSKFFGRFNDEYEIEQRSYEKAARQALAENADKYNIKWLMTVDDAGTRDGRRVRMFFAQWATTEKVKATFINGVYDEALIDVERIG